MSNTLSKRRILKVGVTGGIGSGKSIVCRIFHALGIPVYAADIRARELVEQSAPLRNQIIDLLGEKAFNGNTYNRSWVAARVFADPGLLSGLNRIIHPAVADDFLNWYKSYSDVPYVIEEAAILFESGNYKNMDYSLYVAADEKIRISRIMMRDGSTPEQIHSRMQNQWPADKILPLADTVIDNSGNVLVLPQVLRIHNELLDRYSHG